MHPYSISMSHTLPMPDVKLYLIGPFWTVHESLPAFFICILFDMVLLSAHSRFNFVFCWNIHHLFRSVHFEQSTNHCLHYSYVFYLTWFYYQHIAVFASYFVGIHHLFRSTFTRNSIPQKVTNRQTNSSHVTWCFYVLLSHYHAFADKWSCKLAWRPTAAPMGLLPDA